MADSDLPIGVVLPLHEGERFLDQALASIAAQTWRPVDVLVVDDGSTDRGAAIARAAGVRVLEVPRGGQASARDVGADHVAGEAIAFLDQDDVWRPQKLARQARALLDDPGLAFVGARTEVFLEPGTPRPTWWKAAWDDGAAEPSLLPSATLYRRATLEQVGGFAADPTVRLSEDLSWTSRAQDLGLRPAVVPEVLVAKRVHGDNASNDRSVVLREHLAVVRASIARKRDARA